MKNLSDIDGEHKLIAAQVSERRDVYRASIEWRIWSLGYAVQFYSWIPHEFTSKEECLSNCDSHLNRQKLDGFLPI